jgi:hypothetical protein
VPELLSNRFACRIGRIVLTQNAGRVGRNTREELVQQVVLGRIVFRAFKARNERTHRALELLLLVAVRAGLNLGCEFARLVYLIEQLRCRLRSASGALDVLKVSIDLLLNRRALADTEVRGATFTAACSGSAS